jgi:hypothetical protein
MNQFIGKSIQINGTTLGGISQHTVDFRPTEGNWANSGAIHNKLSAVIREAPKISFSTYAVGGLLTILSNAEIPCYQLNGTTGFKAYVAKELATGPGHAATGHKVYPMPSGIVCLTGLSWSKGGDGFIATADVFGLSSDGTTKALIPASSATYPADVAEEVWTLESATLGGTPIDISSLECSINSGYENNDPEKCYAYGLPQPKDMYRAGNIMVETIIESLDQLFSVPTTGALVTVWRQFSAGAGFGATKTITFVGLSVKEESAPAPGKDASTRRIKITGGLDGSNKPITVS